MKSDQSSDRTGWPTRRTLLGNLAVLGTVGTLAGCSDSGPSSKSSPDGADGTPTATTTTRADSGSFDCNTIPSSLAAFDSTDVTFSFAFDGPSAAEYGVATGEDAVERVASFYFAREGEASTMNWDFNLDVTESVDTYGDVSNTFPKATEVFSVEYDGTTVPVRHQAITDDQDVWVLGLPQDGEFRLAHVTSAVMPGQFGCHETVRALAKDVVESIHPR
ncbi:MAG: hypothetical protein ABEI57_00930 [Halapricum sp.]